MYQKFRAPVPLALTLHVYCTRAKLNRALALLLYPSQGQLNKPRSAALGPAGVQALLGRCLLQCYDGGSGLGA